MAQAFKLMATGMPAFQAAAVGGDVQTGVTAVGASQATAFALGAAITAISTAAASTGVILPSGAAAGDQLTVYNGGANSVTVYPPVGGTINNLSANTGLAVATLKSGVYTCVSALTWFSNLSA